MKHVFSNGTDWMIAHSLKNLEKVYRELCDYGLDETDPFSQINDDVSISIWFEEYNGEIDYKKKYLPKNSRIEFLPDSEWGKNGYPFKVTATAKDWCSVEKVGSLLCSTEF